MTAAAAAGLWACGKSAGDPEHGAAFDVGVYSGGGRVAPELVIKQLPGYAGSVIVITDRRVLDKQLQDAIYQIEHAQAVVKAIDEDSKQFAQALVDGTKIVITTLQKFPFILKGLLHIAGAENLDNPDEASIFKAKEWEAAIAARKYAVIVDKAHSSQTGETARELKRILGAGTQNGTGKAGEDEQPTNWEDAGAFRSRRRQRQTRVFSHLFHEAGH